MIPGVSTTRDPAADTASITASVKKYISTLVVQPVRSSSMQPDVIAIRTSSASSRPSAGHITSWSQRMSGRSPPMPRSAIIGVCAWVFTRPGSSAPGIVRTGVVPAGAVARGPTYPIRPSASTSTTASRSTEQRGSHGSTTGATSRVAVTAAARGGSAASGTAAATPRCRAACRG
jgi:hypothetical protein